MSSDRLDRERLVVARVHAHHLLLHLGEDLVAAHLEQVVGGFQLAQGLAVERGLEVGQDEVALLHGAPFDRVELGELVLQPLDAGVDLLRR